MMKADERYLAAVHSRQGQAEVSWTWSGCPRGPRGAATLTGDPAVFITGNLTKKYNQVVQKK